MNNGDTVVGSVIANLFIWGLAYLIVRFPLKNPDLEPGQRTQALILGLAASGFIFVFVFVFYSQIDFGGYYRAPIVEQAADIPPDGAYLRLHGRVSESSPLNESTLEYAAYLEFDSVVSSSRSVRTSRGEGLLLELQDGTLIEAPELRYPTLEHTRYWQVESNYRFLRRGDEIWCLAFVLPLGTKLESGATYRLDPINYIYQGSEADYAASGLIETGDRWNPVFGALAGVNALAALWLLSILIHTRNQYRPY